MLQKCGPQARNLWPRIKYRENRMKIEADSVESLIGMISMTPEGEAIVYEWLMEACRIFVPIFLKTCRQR